MSLLFSWAAEHRFVTLTHQIEWPCLVLESLKQEVYHYKVVHLKITRQSQYSDFDCAGCTCPLTTHIPSFCSPSGTGSVVFCLVQWVPKILLITPLYLESTRAAFLDWNQELFICATKNSRQQSTEWGVLQRERCLPQCLQGGWGCHGTKQGVGLCSLQSNWWWVQQKEHPF